MLDELKAGDWDAMPEFGVPIATIGMTSTDEDEPGDEPLPWIDLRVFRARPERTIAPDEAVLAVPEATLLLDYPMETPALRIIRAGDGKAFTRYELMAAILSTYESVYDSESLTQSAPTPPPDERGFLLNRPASDGVFGVAMHDLDDLGVSSVEVFNVAGDIRLTPVMES
jgi:hypothetical protein